MEIAFEAELVHWRGPAPHHFLAVPEEHCDLLQEASARVSYGWGVVPVTVRLGATTFTTSLFPKDGGYLLPVKLAVRRAEALELGDVVGVRLTVDA